MEVVKIIKRSDAKASGLPRYFTGKPCARGHVAERNTSSGNCRGCVSEDNARHYATNSASERERSASYYAQNPDYFSSYYKMNKINFRARDADRRASKLNATPEWDAELTDLVATEAADLCVKREAATGFPWQVDHMIPLQARKASGLHTAMNLQVIPAVMNHAKNNRMTLTEPGEWIKYV